MSRGCFSDYVLDAQEAVPLEERLAEEANEAAGEAQAEREAGEIAVSPVYGRRRRTVAIDLSDDGIPF